MTIEERAELAVETFAAGKGNCTQSVLCAWEDKISVDHLIWLNPEEPPRWGGYWGESYGYIARAVDMYPLTVDGLERGMKKLLVNR